MREETGSNRNMGGHLTAVHDRYTFTQNSSHEMTATNDMTTPNDPDDFDLEMHDEGDTLFVSGDIDLHQASKFGERAEMHIRQTESPRLDLTGVLFLDSAGLATLLSLSKLAQTQDKTLRLVATGSPRRVLKITGIDRVLSVED